MCGAERAGKREDPAAAVRFRGLRRVRALRRAWVCVAAMLGVDGDGRPEYSIRRKDQAIVDWSRLGFILADAPKLERNFELRGVTQRSFDDTWEQPWGERRFVRDHGNEMRVTLRDKGGRDLIVVFRVF